jgi:hypothetical protein
VTEQTAATVEERVARHLAAKDWLTTPDRWDQGSAWFRADYLAYASEVIAIVREAAVSTAGPAPATDREAEVCICGHTEAQHFEDVCITEITGCNCRDFLVPEAAREVIDRWREAAMRKTADRAAVLLEAVDIAESLRQFEPAFGARKSAQVSENVGILRVADELRRMAGEARQDPTQDGPRRGDAFEAWLKTQRDEWAPEDSAGWRILDQALQAYRLHADTRTPLAEHVCEGRVVGDCECMERSAAVARSGQPETEA